MSSDLESRLRAIVDDGSLTHLSIAALPRGKGVIWSVALRDADNPGIVLREHADMFVALKRVLGARQEAAGVKQPVAAPPKRRSALDDL